MNNNTPKMILANFPGPVQGVGKPIGKEFTII